MKISIIIPVYNKSKYLKNILQEISGQTFHDFECLLIDDGSKDGSGEICDEFASIDKRFKVFHIPNGGVSHARNLGLDNANGEYVTFIDADDEIYKDYIENLYDCATKSEADIVISGYEKFWDNNDKTVVIHHPQLNGVYDFKECLKNFAKVQKDIGLFGCCVSKIFSLSFCEDVRFDENLRLAEDFDFYLKLYNKTQKIYFDDKHLYRYRQEAENSSVIKDDSKIDYLSQLKINLRYREVLRNLGFYSGENEEIIEKKLSDYLYFSALHCPSEEMDEKFRKLCNIRKNENIKFTSGSFLQKLILKSFKKNKPQLAKLIIKSYRNIKKIIKK